MGKIEIGIPRIGVGDRRRLAILAYSIALDFFHHSFIRILQSLHMTPAMKAGIAEYPMKIEDIVEMLPLPETKKRGKYKPRKKP